MTINDFKFTKEDWYVTFTTPTEIGVRSKGGYICTLPKPTHYTGQNDRYEKETEENKANAKLIASAPKLLEALIEISEAKGRYHPDRLIHASNTIEDMVQLAKDAINNVL